MQLVRFWTMAMIASLFNVIPAFTMQQWCSCDCSLTLGIRPQQVVQAIQVPQASAAAAPQAQQMEESPRTQQSYNAVQPETPLTVIITPAQEPAAIISSPTDLPGSVPQA